MNLNKEQSQAVEQTEGPVRIIAGPGSGKTRTIVSKIEYILKNDLAKPWEILAITFTNKAANEIKERINLGEGIKFNNVFTYHGWCNYFLRMEFDKAGLNQDFRIIDSSDSETRVKNIIKENSLEVDKNDVLTAFEKIAREELNVKSLASSSDGLKVQISVLWDKYRKNKKANGELDFNDLIIEVKKLLSDNEDLANEWKSKYKYLFIDEFQDTNNVQFEIIRKITDNDSNITVVGDPDQNIYSWRGANIDLINNFNKWFPKATTIMLKKNYRSTPEIVESANNLIRNNIDRVQSFSADPVKDTGRPVEIKYHTDERDEAFWIVREIKQLSNDAKANYQDIAIIVRSSYKTRQLESALNYLGVPYKVIGAMKFFDRMEVKQALKFVSFAARQDDNSLLDIINNPPKKFGPTKVMNAKMHAEAEGLTLWDWIRKEKAIQSQAIQEWIDLTEKFIIDINEANDVSNTIEDYIRNIGYMNRIYDEENRVENIREAIKIISTTIINRPKDKSVKEAITDFVNNVSLESASDKSVEEGVVSIVTSHASKGTEFPVVFIYNVVEGHWPSNKSIEEGNLEEERRVMYVAMTRAMNRLYLTTSDGFNHFNKPVEQSRFIEEFYESNQYNYIDSHSQSKEEPSDEEIDQINEIGKRISHKTLGEGKIIDKNGDYIKVKFDNGDKIEILMGHPSYIVRD